MIPARKEEGLSQKKHDPFGMLLVGRNWEGGSEYRFGFNGKESDKETYGEANIYDYGFRIYNPRLGKFLSVDPLSKSYAYYTPYQFAGNTPIQAIDLDGLEEFIIHFETFRNSKGETILYKVNHRYLTPAERGNHNPSTFMIDNTSPASSIITTKYDKKYMQNHSEAYGSSETTIMENQAYNRAINQFRKDGGNLGQTYTQFGSDILQLNTTIYFDTDQGMNSSEVEEAFNISSEETQLAIDNIVGALLYDKSATLNIEGLASPKATNLKKTVSTLDTKNNEALAIKRAESTRDFIIKFAADNYGAVITTERFNLTSKISNSDSSGSTSSNLSTDRAANITLKNTE
ncbi:MAG: hypothetical protein IPQ11_12180 [Bacteroidetes bacterium]|nr:hypothetical protein [Bacteroidota bacterium]